MAADRAINMALRVLGIGEAERDFKRVGEAGSKSFAAVEKSANGAAREVSEYTARLKRAAAEANRLVANTPALNKGSAAQIQANQRDFKLGFIRAEQERILKGLPDVTRNMNSAEVASVGFAGGLGRVTALGAAAGTAIYALGNFLADSVGAFAEHERAINSFNAKLEWAGNRSNATGAEIKAMAEKVVEATRQTEKASLDAAAELARVPGISKEGMEEALLATAKFADAMDMDLSQAIEKTIGVATALSNRDMPALSKALEGVNDQTAVMVMRLAEAGKTAEAQKAYLAGLSKAAGAETGGLADATNKASDAWNKLKSKLGEAIAPAATTFFNGLSNMLDVFSGKTDNAATRWGRFLMLLSNPITAPIGFRKLLEEPDRGNPPADQKPGLLSSGMDLVQRVVTGATNAANAAARQALDKKYSGDPKTAKAGSGSGSTSSLGDAVALIKQLFPTAIITSTDGGKHKKGSDHYARRAVDFVIPGMMNPAGTAEVERRMEAAGWNFRRNAKGTKQFFGPGRHAETPGDHDDHFHGAFDGSPSPERAAAAAQRARDEAIRRERAYQQELAGLDAEILRDRIAIAGDGAEATRLARQQLAVESDKYRAGVEAKVKLGELTEKQGLELMYADAIATSLKDQALTRQEQTRKLQEDFADQVAANDNQRDLLSSQAAIADTAAERKKLALALLKLDQEEERLRLKEIIDIGKKAEATEQQRKDAERAAARLAVLPTIESNQTKSVEREHRTRLETFIADTATGGVEEKVNDLVFDELMSVRRGVNSAISSALGTDDPLITGLIEVLLDQILFRPLAQALAAGQSSGGGLGGLVGSIVGAVAGGIGGGGGFSLGQGASVSGLSAGGIIGGFAGGTPGVPLGRDFMVGENGIERMRYHGGNRLEVISGPATHRMANDNGSVTIVQNYHIRERADPRITRSSAERGMMDGLARSARRGLAVPPRRPGR